MKMSLKELKGTIFNIEVNEAEATVGDLKALIHASKSEYDKDTVKLIYSGRILANESLVKDLEIKQGQFVVVMATKPKKEAPSAPAAAAAPAAPAAIPAVPSVGGQDAATPPPQEGGASPLDQLRNHPQLPQLAAAVMQNPQMLAAILPQLAQSNPEIMEAIRNNPEELMRILQEAAAESGPTVIRLTEEEHAAVQRLADLGFSRRAAAEAYLACGKNEEIAANFLLESGDDDGDVDDDIGETPDAQLVDDIDPAALARLRTLRNNPQFPALSQMVLQDPNILHQILPALGAADPELLQIVQQHPRALFELMAEATGIAPGGGGGAPPAGSPGQPMGSQLSESEQAAVDRLEELGFARAGALQAYLACGKNEELAANFLFENGRTD